MGSCVTKGSIIKSTAIRKLNNEEITTSSVDIRKVYKFDKNIIGHGHFGTVRIATLISNPNLKFAVKTIAKEKIGRDLHMVMRELEIIKQLDHPNIVKFYETYQDAKFFHLVMEYCSGGELLERIIQKGHFSESEAVNIMYKAFSAVKHIHQKNIVHRDLKPENFLFSSTEPDAEIKIIDFGLSNKYSSCNGNCLTTIVGTTLYVAPEVLKGNYNEKCDEWSLGVIMYILLSGCTPFEGINNREIFTKIIASDYKLEGTEWINISKEGKDLIKKLLEPDPGKRISASMALEHDWFTIKLSNELSSLVFEGEMDAKILRMLRNYQSTTKLRKEAMKIMVNFLSDSEIKNLRQTFKKIDKDKSGIITIKELQDAMKQMGYSDTEKEIAKIIEKIHLDDENVIINYQEFLRTTLDSKIYLNNEKLWTVFKYFDVDNSNYITAENLKEAFARAGRKLPDHEFHNMIKEVDINNHGKIDFDQFVHMMIPDNPNSYRETTPTPLPSPEVSYRQQSSEKISYKQELSDNRCQSVGILPNHADWN